MLASGKGFLREPLPVLVTSLPVMLPARRNLFCRNIVWLVLAATSVWAEPTRAQRVPASTVPPSSNEDSIRLVVRGAGLLGQGHAAEAEPLLRRALQLDPRSGLAHTYLGQVLLAHHRLAEAMDEFEAVLAYEAKDEAAREGERSAAEGAAVQLRNDGKNEVALSVLQRALNLLPDDTVLLTDLGIQAQSMHRLSMADEALTRVLELQPEEPRALYALARTEIDQDRFAPAEAHLHAYLALRPNDATAHYGLGHLYQLQQQTEAAKAEFGRSLALQPQQTESYYQLGQIELEAGADAEARAHFLVVLKRLPAHGGALTGLGILDYRAHLYESARASLEKAAASSPEFQPAQYYLGLTLKRLGQTAASEAALQRAAELTARQQGKGQPTLQAPSTALGHDATVNILYR